MSEMVDVVATVLNMCIDSQSIENAVMQYFNATIHITTIGSREERECVNPNVDQANSATTTTSTNYV